MALHRKNLTCGLIFVPIMVFMVMKIFTFGSSAPLQKRSSDCQCFLSCDGAMERLKQLKSVHVRVEHQSEEVHEEIYNVSSLLKEDGHCSVVVLKCLQGTQFVRIYADGKDPVPEQLYENTNSKPECTKKNPRSGADRDFSNKLLILLIFCCFVFVF